MSDTKTDHGYDHVDCGKPKCDHQFQYCRACDEAYCEECGMTFTPACKLNHLVEYIPGITWPSIDPVGPTWRQPSDTTGRLTISSGCSGMGGPSLGVIS